MNKKIYIISAFSIIPMSAVLAQMSENPNVIIILSDDIGYGDIGWLGSKTIETPHINRLATEGIRFTNCHSTSATSTPSRYGLLTGIYPWRKKGTGVAAGDAAMIIKPEQFTLADLFKKANYTTAAIGKWHLGLGAEEGKQNWNDEISPALRDIGFDYSFIMAATGDRVPCVYIENGKVVNLDPADPIEVSYKTPFAGEPTGAKNPELLRIHPSHGHDMAIVDGISRIGYMRGGTSARWHDEDIADRITEKAMEFIKSNQNHPFFLYVGTNDIHVPRVPHERFTGKSGMGPRGDAILSLDYTVGAVMETLDKLKIAENTILIFTSDNGPVVDDGYKDKAEELLGSHTPAGKLRGGKYSIFEGGTRVPLILKWKNKAKKNMTSNALISQIDIFASMAALLKVELPKHAAMDSKNHLRTFMGKTKRGRTVLVEQNANNTLSLVTPNWKYIEPSKAPAINSYTKIELGNNKEKQLYNLKTDLQEKNNVAKKHQKTVKSLEEKLSKIKNL